MLTIFYIVFAAIAIFFIFLLSKHVTSSLFDDYLIFILCLHYPFSHAPAEPQLPVPFDPEVV